MRLPYLQPHTERKRQTVRFVESLRAGVRGRKIGPEKKSGQ